VIDATARTGETINSIATVRIALSFFISLPSKGLLVAIDFYRRLVSPMLPGFFGPLAACRFEPSCSCYAAEAVSRHGAIRGAALTLFRIARCNPFCSGGLDPVPPSTFARASFRPRCVRSHP
jgi:putative membrane protein insertion efficiency factor